MGGIISNLDAKPLCVGGYLDHVHLLIGFKPKYRISDLVRGLKANSTNWLKAEAHLGLFAWQRGYSIFSVSKSQVDVVRKYIDNQVQHHSRMSFESELRVLLTRHGIEFSEEYLLD